MRRNCDTGLCRSQSSCPGTQHRSFLKGYLEVNFVNFPKHSCSNSWLQSYRGWDTPQTQQHVKKLKCHRPNNPEDFLIKDYDFSRLSCMSFGSTESDKSRVLVGLIAATITLLTLSVILFIVRYRKRLIFRYRQFKYRRHTNSAFTIDHKYSDLSTNGDLHGDTPNTRDKANLLT